MDIHLARSSSINTYRMCSFKYFLEYVLGMESLSGKAALQGTIAHSVFETMAKCKKEGGEQEDPIKILDREWEKHTKENPHIELLKFTKKQGKISADYIKCCNAIKAIVDDPDYNPALIDVVDVEKKFDIPMPGKAWEIIKADGSVGQLELSGTMDLIRRINDDTIEVVDWKTGKRTDWVTSEQKDFYDLMKDVQPRLYHMAATMLYPWARNVLVTFYYMLDGGPFMLPFDLTDVVTTAEGLHKHFMAIKKDGSMRRSRGWKCKSFCFFGRNGMCERVWADIHTLGQKEVISAYTGMTADKQKELNEPAAVESQEA